MNKVVMLIFIAAISLSFASNAVSDDSKSGQQGFRIIMTDDRGLPLEDGMYNVTVKVYDSPSGGAVIDEITVVTESKKGVCMICDDYLNKLSSMGHKQVWISLKIENYSEPRFRTRVFLDRFK